MKPPGRPKLPAKQVRGTVVATRVSIPEHKQIIAAATRTGKRKSIWVREALVEASKPDLNNEARQRE